jgi:hypothetical protein
VLKTHSQCKNLSNLTLYIYNILFRCSFLVNEEKMMAPSGHHVPFLLTKRKKKPFMPTNFTNFLGKNNYVKILGIGI